MLQLASTSGLCAASASLDVLRIALLSLALCACTQARFASKPDPHLADPAVYRAVLDTMSAPQGAKRPTQLVVIDSTFTIQPQDLELDKVPGADSAALSDFQKGNSKSHSLSYLSAPALSVPIVLVSRQTLDSFLHNGPEPYWSEFYRRYPGSNGSISFSSIGYSADGNVALLVAEHSCATLCGELSNVVVKRERGRWRVAVIQIKIVS
jgi:hypothetical protein